MSSSIIVWQAQDNDPTDNQPPLPASKGVPIHRPEVLATIEAAIDSLSADLRALSLDLHDHPELKFEEKHAHQVLTSFLAAHGFEVTPSYFLPTAWLATYTRPSPDPLVKLRTLGVNSEMDALPGVGHACGHNLIAIAGVAIACAVKAAMEKWDIPGRIELLGTPAEEGGQGKVILLKRGAYKNMDVCLMCHPAPGPRGSISLSGSLAMHCMNVEFSGHTAHAALAPWEGQNALDAAVLAYTNISLLRQQLRPTHRVHGIINSPAEGKAWAPGIIPDNARMTYYVRAPTCGEVEVAVKRVKACFSAAATATGCTVDIEDISSHAELSQNKVLGDELATIVKSQYGDIDYEWGIKYASTDFGDVTYAMPSLHPGFSIPTKPNGGNHTREFADSARTLAAHDASLTTAKALAATGARVLYDEKFSKRVKDSFLEDQKAREKK